jgi:hypothetical protein
VFKGRKKIEMKPLNGVRYTISGNDGQGDWSCLAECRHYSQSNPNALSKFQRKWGYRWVTDTDHVIPANEVDAFRAIGEE